MGNLIKLVQLCINDSNFYTSDDDRKNYIRHDFDNFNWSYYSEKISEINELNNKNVDYTTELRLKQILYSDSIVALIKHSGIIIYFDKKPEIHVKSEINLVNSEIKKDIVTLKNKKFFGLINNDITYNISYKLETYETKFYIYCGYVKEEITYSEFIDIVDTFKKNTVDLRLVSDTQIVNERLLVYNTKSPNEPGIISKALEKLGEDNFNEIADKFTSNKNTQTEQENQELIDFLEHISNNVGSVITEYHWREANELLLKYDS